MGLAPSDRHQNPYERTTRDTWLVFKIMAEFVEGFELLKDVDPAVSIFGSARFGPKSKHWKLASRASEAITASGLSLITGGGPGLMEAASQGAKKGIAKFKRLQPKRQPPRSVGLTIELPFESKANPFLDLEVRFKYFFCRKVIFAKYARAFVILPGGFGTIDELSEALTLIQTQKMDPFPIILLGTDYWGGLMDWMKKTLVAEGAIRKSDLEILRLTDDPDEMVRWIYEGFQKPSLKKRTRAKA